MDAGNMGGMGGAGGAGGGTDWSQISKLFSGGKEKKKKSIFPEDIRAQGINDSRNPFLESLVATIKEKQAEKAAGNPGQILKQAFAANKLQAAPAAEIVDQPIQPMQQPAPLNPQEFDEFGNPIQKRMLLS